MNKTLRSAWARHLLVGAAYLALALALTWPLALHLSTHVPGDGADDPPLTWNLWWVPHALLTLKANPFESDFLFYPLGINLALYTLTVLNGLLSIPLQATLGLIPASNVLLLFSFVAGGYGTFLLVRTLVRGRFGAPAAFVAGLLYAFAANKLFYAALGQWNIASSHWIPFYVLALARMEDEPERWRYALLAALFLLFQAYAEMTFASFLALFTVLWAAWPCPGRLTGRVWLLRPLAVAGLLFTAGLAPVLAMMIPDLWTEGPLLVEGSGFADVFSADLLGFLVPTMHHPLLGSLVNRFRFDHSVGQHVYVGYTTLALALIGTAARWKAGPAQDGSRAAPDRQPGVLRGSKFWIASSLGFWLLTLGPALRVNGQDTGLPLPFTLVSKLPFFEGNRYPSRYSVMLLLSLAVLAAFGLAAISARMVGRARQTVTRLIPVFVALVLLFEHLSIPLPLSDMRIPAVYQAIAAMPGDVTVLDLPVAWRNGFRVTGTQHPIVMFEQYYQTMHGKRLLAGNTSRNPPLKFQYFTEAPVINTLIALETGHPVEPAVIERDRVLAPEVLRFFSIGVVVVHPAQAGPATLAYVEEALPVSRMQDIGPDGLVVYRTQIPPWPETWTVDPGDPVRRLSYAEGWGAASPDLAWAQRRAVRLLVPASGKRRQMAFRAYVPGEGQHLRVEINGHTAARLAMSAGWGDYRLDLLPGAEGPGLSEVWLTFERLYPAGGIELSPRAIGRTGVESPVNLVVQSAGQEVGDFGHIYVDGRDVSPNLRGYNVAVLHPESGVVEQTASFDTHLDPAAGRALALFLDAVPTGHVVAIAAADEASRLLSAEAVAALRAVGATGDLRDRLRWAHAIIGVKGAAPGTAVEAMDRMRPVSLVVGEGLTEPSLAAAFGPLQFQPQPSELEE